MAILGTKGPSWPHTRAYLPTFVLADDGEPEQGIDLEVVGVDEEGVVARVHAGVAKTTRGDSRS